MYLRCTAIVLLVAPQLRCIIPRMLCRQVKNGSLALLAPVVQVVQGRTHGDALAVFCCFLLIFGAPPVVDLPFVQAGASGASGACRLRACVHACVHCQQQHPCTMWQQAQPACTTCWTTRGCRRCCSSSAPPPAGQGSHFTL